MLLVPSLAASPLPYPPQSPSACQCRRSPEWLRDKEEKPRDSLQPVSQWSVASASLWCTCESSVFSWTLIWALGEPKLSQSLSTVVSSCDTRSSCLSGETVDGG
ncbi:uncharacterized protein LOC135097977 [Scylla paramamosain]|uniref:uncharacterized protein LOC135097977 n=1 Tax=Scylla paramamosain TaxID=85552 RepID=UPI0030828561